MKWLKFFRKRKKADQEAEDAEGSGVSDGEDGSDEELEHSMAHKRRAQEDAGGSGQQCTVRAPRPSLEQWFEARRARTSIDVDSTTTTERLTVCKAGVTTLINRTYIVIKHLGSGTYGQVKLAFNLRDKKLYAIKSCRKSQYQSLVSPRANSLSRSRRSVNGINAMTANLQLQPQQQQQPAAAAAAAPGAHTVQASGAAAAAPQQQQESAPGHGPRHGGSSWPQVPHFAANGQQQQQQHQQQQQRPAHHQPLPNSMWGRAPMFGGQAQRGAAAAAVGQTPAQPPRAPLPWGGSATAAQGSNMQAAQGAAAGSHAAAGVAAAAAGGGGGGGMAMGPPPAAGAGFQQQQQQGGSNSSMNGGAAAAALGVGVQRAGSLLAGPPQAYRYSSAVGCMGMRAAVGSGKAREGAMAARGGGQAIAPAGVRLRADEWVREIAIMKKLSHPNIVRLVEVIDDPASDTLLLVMEYVEGNSLHPPRIDPTHWEPVPEPIAWCRARDVLQGLDYLHFHGVVHGDMKPANLMLDTNTRQVKIVDFGSAVLTPGAASVPGGFAASMGGGAMSCTPAFRSPESLHSGYRPSYELDMWALGVTVYLWVFGQLPFNGAAPFLIYESIRRQDIKFPSSTDARGEPLSMELMDFLRRVLDKDPLKRLDVVGALNHPWVHGRGTAPLPIIQRGMATAMEEDAVVLVGDQQTPLMSAQSEESSGASPSRFAHGPTSPPAAAGGAGTEEVTSRAVAAGVAASAAAGMDAAGGSDTVQPAPRVHRRRRRCSTLHRIRAVSQEELDRAVSESVGGHAVSELMGMLFEEVRFAPRQIIVRAGDPVDKIYLIAQGEVEIYQELPAEEAAAAASMLGHHHGRPRMLSSTLGPPSDPALGCASSTDPLKLAAAAAAGLASPLPATAAAHGLLSPLQSPHQQGGGGGGASSSVVLLPPTTSTAAAAAQGTMQVTNGTATAMDTDTASGQLPMQRHNSTYLAATGQQPINHQQAAHQQQQGLQQGHGTHHYFTAAAATSLAQPIISGVGIGGREAQVAEGEDDDDMPGFLDDVPGSLLSIFHSNTAHGTLRDGMHSMHSGGLTRLMQGGPHSNTSLPLHSNSNSLGGPSVVVLATKGPGDSLGWTNLEPCNSSCSGAARGSAADAAGGAAAAAAAAAGSCRRGTAELCTVSPVVGMVCTQLPTDGDHDMEGLQHRTPQPALESGPQPQPLPPPQQPVWRAHVRTKGEVVAFMADMANMRQLVRTYPELEAAMKNIAVQQETDLMVAEALRQLRLVSAGIPPQSPVRTQTAAAAAGSTAQCNNAPVTMLSANAASQVQGLQQTLHAAAQQHSNPAAAAGSGPQRQQMSWGAFGGFNAAQGPQQPQLQQQQSKQQQQRQVMRLEAAA